METSRSKSGSKPLDFGVLWLTPVRAQEDTYCWECRAVGIQREHVCTCSWNKESICSRRNSRRDPCFRRNSGRDPCFRRNSGRDLCFRRNSGAGSITWLLSLFLPSWNNPGWSREGGKNWKCSPNHVGAIGWWQKSSGCQGTSGITASNVSWCAITGNETPHAHSKMRDVSIWTHYGQASCFPSRLPQAGIKTRLE